MFIFIFYFLNQVTLLFFCAIYMKVGSEDFLREIFFRSTFGDNS